jgi:predicted SAM-dependent methyltransferase
MEKTKLILGFAGKKDDTAVTVDIDPRHQPDCVHDLNMVPWPFEDNQFASIFCHHVLEHLLDLSLVMKELHRICRREGTITIEIPHYSSWMANDPEHKLRFSFFSFNAYINDQPHDWHLTDFKFRLLEREITFHKVYRRYGLHRLWNRFPLTYERFWTYIMPAEHLILKLQPLK